MKSVNIVPQSHQLTTSFQVVPNGQSKEFVFVSDCMFRELRTLVTFDETAVMPTYEGCEAGYRPFEPDDAIRVRFTSRYHDRVDVPIRGFVYFPLGSGVDFGIPAFESAGSQFALTVVNNSKEPIQCRFFMTGAGFLPTIPPPKNTTWSKLPEKHEWICLDEECSHKLPKRSSKEWSGLHIGVGGHWYRRDVVTGAWEVFKFEVEPTPEEDSRYEWAKYKTAVNYN